MEQVGTPPEVLEDVRIKEERVRGFLEQKGLDALVLGRQDNFAWITAGGDNRVINNTDMGEGFAVITRDRKWLVAHHMDGRRFIEEQAPDQGYELVTLYWHQGSPVDRVAELTRGKRVGADFPLPGAQHFTSELVDLHYPFTDLDLKRLRWVGRTSNQIITQIAHELEPGMAENEVAARLAYEYTRRGMLLDALMVGADERITRYRHPLASDKPIQRYAFLHPAARRWGLHANVTRLVHFGQPPEAIRAAHHAVTTVGAHVARMLAPGVRFADILAEEKRLYDELGYPDEWNYHFLGGISGYTLVDPTRCLNPEARVVERQSYGYFITITGAKFEELMILTEEGVELASLPPDAEWPTRVASTPYGDIAVPEILVR
ncbi:MAG: M24 family metallopeptidase [Anaerolineae bacterium]